MGVALGPLIAVVDDDVSLREALTSLAADHDFLLAGGKSPEEAIASCMFETVGQA